MTTDGNKDLLEQGAIVQRDKETYAVAPHIPGGIITDTNVLRNIADVADKYQCAALKLTSAQRIALVGIKPEELEQVWQDLGMDKGHAIGMCVRSVKICPGTTFCKRAQQDSVSLGLKLDKKYYGYQLPSKLKMGVSGCMNSCAESAIKDIGMIGTLAGYTVMVGGAASGYGRLGQVVAQKKSEEQVLAIVERLIDLYQSAGKKGQRMGRFVDKVGMELVTSYVESAPEALEELKVKARELNQ
ncbi:MAG TPA: NAD(P)/FAD-dependent oxidoreductase [Bacillota bacterium]|nr:NAD(P)/FAD-dependent oxidoreductase [Bacillota bacterium]